MNRIPLDPPAILRQAEDEDAAYINAEYQAAESGEEKVLERRLNAGRRLNEKKAKIHENKKVGWQAWLKTHLILTQPTASRHMAFATQVDERQKSINRLLTFAEKQEIWAGTGTRHSQPEEGPPTPPAPAPAAPTPHPTEPAPAAANGQQGGGSTPAPQPPKPPPPPPAPAQHPAPEPVPEAEPSLPPPPDGEYVVPAYVTLEQWRSLTPGQRAAVLQHPGKATFNYQGDKPQIEWALWSWNPVSGCEHNCPYCYARDIADGLYKQKFAPSVWPQRLKAPQKTTFPEAKVTEALAAGTPEAKVKALGLRNVFTCSMADLFGRWVPQEWIAAVLAEVRAAPQWNFLFLTKFPNRLAEFEFPDNAWVGTTVDCQARVANAERSFRKVRAGVKWLSCEPLLEPLRFTDIGAFHWVVLGGASSSTQTPEWRPPRKWVNDLEAAATKAGCKVYEKTNLLDRVRQYPGTEEDGAALPEPLRYLPMDAGASASTER